MDTALKFKLITETQNKLAKELYTGQNQYNRLLKAYERLPITLSNKFYTHDAVVFIINEGGLGFKIVKFYNDGLDYRVVPGYKSLAEAQTEAICYL